MKVTTKPSRKDAFWLQFFLGLIFPAGMAEQGLWGAVGIDLSLEALGAGVTLYFAKFAKLIEPVIAPATGMELQMVGKDDGAIGASVPAGPSGVRWTKKRKILTGLAWAPHVGSWATASWAFGEFSYPDPVFNRWTNKNAGEADIVVIGQKIAETSRITLNTFGADSCAVSEGCIGGPGERRLLRFDAYIYNKGDGDFLTAYEDINPVWGECHGHWHSPDATSYFMTQRLNNANVSAVVQYGHKQGYCFRDNTRISGDHWGKYWCGLAKVSKHLTHGITAGWADIYDGSLDCQWIDITNVPAGTYELEVTINPKGVYHQDNPDNNHVIVSVIIPPRDNDALERTGNGRPVDALLVKEYDQ